MTEGPPQIARVEPGDVTPTLVTALYTGALVSRVEAGVVALTGPGAVTSFQGLLTNDVELPGDGSFVYGALLTPKGMIVVDGWAARLGATVSYTVPAHGGGRERALGIFTRSVPPRLARVSDRTSEVAVYRLAGPGALAVGVAAGLEVPPAAGRVLPRPDGLETARATEGAPFVLQVTVPAAAAVLLAARLEAAGAVAAGPATLELSRILAGWPRLGAEVDDRTIPQEARLDQIGGVSYTKGCYTGQETVARLHFRGHVNRQIRGLLFDPEPPAAPADGWSVVTYVDRDVGRVTSLAFVPETGVAGAGRWIGLALIRREVEPGSVVRAAGRSAAVVQRRASWEQYVAVNVDGTRLAVDAARTAGARLIHISSVAVYAGSAAYPATPERRDEDFPFQPIAAPDFYARSKRMAEDVVREAATHRDFAVAALRPTVIYGERDRLFTPRVIRAARLRFVPRIGPGTNRLSCVYAGNVASAAVAALDAPLQGFRAYNVTSDGPPALSQREFFAAFAAALGRRTWSIPIPTPLAGLVIGLFTARRLARAAVSFASGDNPYTDERIRAELVWRPPTQARAAIGRTVAC